MNQKGFTLVEIIAVMVILGILIAMAVPKYIDLEKNAKTQAATTAVAELTSREHMIWSNTKISSSGWQDDAKILLELNADGNPPNLSEGYKWSGLAVTGENAVEFKGEIFTLSRAASTATNPGGWKRK